MPTPRLLRAAQALFVIFVFRPTGEAHAQTARGSLGVDGPGPGVPDDGLDNKPSRGGDDLLDVLLADFNPRIRPLDGGPPVRVRCGLHVVSLSSIHEISMDYKLDIFLRQMWEDPRLAFSSHMGAGRDPLQVPYSSIARLWQPPIHLPNELDAQLHVIPMPSISYKIFPNGTIFYSVRVTLTLACPMNLASFPMDKQECQLKLESYSMLTRDLMLDWQVNPIHLSEDMELPQFQLKSVSTDSCVKHYKLGLYSCLIASFYLDRQYGFYLLQTYIPTVLIVVLSWVSFWISMDAIPARISLGVTTVLTMATQLSGSLTSIPRVSYPKAIDIWMSTCMAFVFAALLEYAFVSSLSGKQDEAVPEKNPSVKNARFVERPTGQEGAEKYKIEAERNMSKACNRRKRQRCCGISQRDVAENIDRISRVLFPCLFLVFNIAYWTTYTQSSY